VTIAPSANPVDAGTLVTFSPTPVNGGTPAYQWFKNALAVGSGATYTCVPENGDQVTVVLTSDIACVSGNPATSDQVTMIVNSVSVTLNISNLTVSGSQCFNATQTITVAGSGSSFTVPDGGHATMIAGQNILFFPGTLVESGGYLHGYIAPGGPYCLPQPLPSVLQGTVEGVISGLQTFRVYPNPTSGTFTLEMTGDTGSKRTTVEIYTMKGEKIFSAVLTEERKHEFSLSGQPVGLYLIRVNSDGLFGS
jgi:hypothetical protein